MVRAAPVRSGPAGRTVAGDTGSPACAAAAAARRASAGAVAGFTLLASTASPSCSTMPSASGVRSGRRISRSPASVKAPRPGPAITRPTRCQVRSLACTTVRPMAETWRSNISRSSRPIRAATASWSCCCSRSVALPGHGLDRIPDIEQRGPGLLQTLVRAVGDPGGSDGPHHHQVPQPAAGLLEVGSGGKGQLAAPLRALFAGRQQRRQPILGVRAPVGEHPTVQGAGQLGVAGDVPQVEQPSAAGRSCLATCRAPPTERTEWSSRIPESQIGYQSRSASISGVGRRRLGRVQQHQVEVGERRQFPPAESTDRDQRDPADVHPGLRGQAGQPAVGQSGKSPAPGRTGDAGPAQQLGSQFRESARLSRIRRCRTQRRPESNGKTPISYSAS